MKILEVRALPARYLTSWGTLQVSDRDPPMDLRFLRRGVALGDPYAPYLGLVAVDRGEVAAQVMVERTRLVTPSGPEPCSAITGVITRPDALGRGLCSRLFREVHRRERDLGIRRALLWTHRTWSAHRLYEHLGYRDIYSPPTAVRSPPRGRAGRLPDGWSARAARRSDARLLARLLNRSNRGRTGLVRRFPESFALRFALGWRMPKDHLILRLRGRPAGYVGATQDRRSVAVHEVAVADATGRAAAVIAVERLARSRWVTFSSTTFVRDARELLLERGYHLASSDHIVLMSRNLGRSPTLGLRDLRELCASSAFAQHRGDIF